MLAPIRSKNPVLEVNGENLLLSRGGGNGLTINANIQRDYISVNGIEKRFSTKAFIPFHRFNTPWWWGIDAWTVDYTLTRMGYATYIDKDGIMQYGVTNTPRIQQNGLLNEGAGANILLQVLTDWTDTNLTPVMDATDWFGVANKAWTLTAGANDGTLISAVQTSSTTDHTFLVGVRRKTGTGAFSMTIDNGGTWTVKVLTSSYQYFSVSKAAADPQLGFKLATSGDTIEVCIPNLFTTIYATSAINNDGLSLATMQDFSTGSETDVPGKLNVYPSIIELVNGDRDEDYYLTLDQTAGAITDFTHRVTICMTDNGVDGYSEFYTWAVSNADDDLGDIDIANGSYLSISMIWASPTQYQIRLQECDEGALTAAIDTSEKIDTGTVVYLSIDRTGTTAAAEIYSTAALRDAGAAGDIDTIGGTVINTAFRYAYGIASRNNGQTAKDISGWVANLTLTDGAIEKVIDPGFDCVTDDVGELATGLLTIGNCYLISLRTDGDFISAGSPDNVAGTYFNATTTGVGLLDAGDKVFPVTFTHWTAGTGWAPQATAGSLTGKAQKIGNGIATLSQAILTEGLVYRFSASLTDCVGTARIYFGATKIKDITASGDYVLYGIAGAGGSLSIISAAALVISVDDVEVVEYGHVRVSEAGIQKISLPADVKFAEELGAELLPLGDCTTDWFDVAQGNWTYDAVNDEYDQDGTQFSQWRMWEDVVLTVGQMYKCSFEIKNWIAGSAWLRLGSGAIGASGGADGVFTSYIKATSTRFAVESSTTFNGSVTNFTVKEVEVEAQGTMFCRITPGFSEAQASADNAFLSINADGLFLYHDVSSNGFASHDGTTEATLALTFVAGTSYILFIHWGSKDGTSRKFQIGALDCSSRIIKWGAIFAFDGAYTTGADIIAGYDSERPFELRDLLFLPLLDPVLEWEQIENIAREMA